MRLKKALCFLLLAVGGLSLLTAAIRQYLTTGNWYPKDQERLESMLTSLLAQARPVAVSGRIKGLIAPHAGFQFSGKCAAAAYNKIQSAEIKRVIVLGGSHHSGFSGAVLSDFDYYATPLGRIPVDRAAMRGLAANNYFTINNLITQDEHSIENQLPFLQKVLGKKEYTLVPILLGQLKKEDFRSLAKMIAPWVDEKTLVVASTDLTHYGQVFGYLPFSDNVSENLKKLDFGLLDFILKLDFNGFFNYRQKTEITVCGYVPVGILMNLFNPQDTQVTLTDYYRSGDLNNDYSLSVSYASLLFSQKTTLPGDNPGNKAELKSEASVLSRDEKKTLLEIARLTLGSFVEKDMTPQVSENLHDLTANLRKKSGVFVTLREKGELRGCIGSLVGSKELYQEVIDNTVNAASRDPRFPAVQRSELSKIDIEISVMTPLKRISNYRQIRLGTDGVIIRLGYNQAVFLPQVATETGWNLNEFLANLCRKAGLPANAYVNSPDMEFVIFQAEVFSENELKR